MFPAPGADGGETKHDLWPIPGVPADWHQVHCLATFLHRIRFAAEESVDQSEDGEIFRWCLSPSRLFRLRTREKQALQCHLLLAFHPRQPAFVEGVRKRDVLRSSQRLVPLGSRKKAARAV